MKNLKEIIETQNFLVNKKLTHRQREYKYAPQNYTELINIINKLILNEETDLNCIDISKINDLCKLITDTIKKTLYNNLLIIKPMEETKEVPDVIQIKKEEPIKEKTTEKYEFTIDIAFVNDFDF